MSAPLVVVVISGTATVLLALLFSHERQRGQRYLARLRDALDGALSETWREFKKAFPRVRADFVRQLAYYIAHSVLSVLLIAIHALESFVMRLVRSSRKRAREASLGNGESSQHLSQIAQHKREMELSPEEKQERKESALRGE